MEYLIAFLISLGLNILMFIPAFLFKTDKLTDISYALTFAIVAIVLFLDSAKEFGHVILLFMVLLWAFRLGSYLFMRIRKIKRDKRFDDKRDSFVKFGSFWLLQGITVFIVMLSSVKYMATDGAIVSSISLIGFLVFILGIVIETFADLQKYRFINDETNKGKWIDEGLWHYSRHPNYFGEILVWVGVFVFALPALQGIHILVGLLSPVYIASLIIFVSGIPLLEKGADERWGSNPDYIKYKQTTSVLVLLPKKAGT